MQQRSQDRTATLSDDECEKCGLAQLSGTVDSITETPAPSAMIRLHEPVHGILSPLACAPTGAPVMIVMGLYLYGDTAADFVAHEEPKWQAWMKETFPTT